MHARVLIGVLCLFSAGCAVREANLKAFDNRRPASPAERAAILDHVRNQFFDPYSVRDAEIADAVPSATIDSQTLYNVCFRANAKNRMGAYTGRKTSLFHMDTSAKIISETDDMFAENFCDDGRLHYQRFDEIDRLAAK